jgi:hypothetical protein
MKKYIFATVNYPILDEMFVPLPLYEYKKYEGFLTQFGLLFGVKWVKDIVIKEVYQAFGLSVTSDITLPELPKMIIKEHHTDIVIETADLSKPWSELAPPQKKTVVEKDLFMFLVPKVAIFSIQKGERIIVSPMKGSDEDEIRLFILGTCMGALLIQRKVLPLHGSALAIAGKAYGFIGDSGAGKSTLASAFLSKGYQLLSDDVIAISFAHDNTPFVLPAYPQQKLWQESLQQFGMENSCYRPIYQRETKYAVPVPAKFYTEPLPLAGLFELIKTESENIEIHRIQSLERLQTLFLHTYRNFLIPRAGLTEWHFNTSVKIMNQISIFQLRRPTSGFTAHQLAALILTTLDEVKL